MADVKKVYLRLHSTEGLDMLAMCDSDLLGRVLNNDDGLELNLKDYSEFYVGELLIAQEAERRISKDNIGPANIVGSLSIEIAVKKGVINGKNVKEMGGIPYASAFRMD